MRWEVLLVMSMTGCDLLDGYAVDEAEPSDETWEEVVEPPPAIVGTWGVTQFQGKSTFLGEVDVVESLDPSGDLVIADDGGFDIEVRFLEQGNLLVFAFQGETRQLEDPISHFDTVGSLTFVLDGAPSEVAVDEVDLDGEAACELRSEDALVCVSLVEGLVFPTDDPNAEPVPAQIEWAATFTRVP